MINVPTYNKSKLPISKSFQNLIQIDRNYSASVLISTASAGTFYDAVGNLVEFINTTASNSQLSVSSSVSNLSLYSDDLIYGIYRNCLAWWSFDPLLTDGSGNGHVLSNQSRIGGNVITGSGIYRNCAFGFNTSSCYLSASTSTGWNNLSTSSWTIGCWMNTTNDINSDSEIVISNFSLGTPSGAVWAFANITGSSYFVGSPYTPDTLDGTYYKICDIIPNKWTFIVATYDNSLNSLTLYSDAIITNTVQGTGNLINNSSIPITIGAGISGVPPIYPVGTFTGKIDEAFMYNRALSPLEIQLIKNNLTFLNNPYISASYALTSSWNLTSSYTTTSSYAVSASWAPAGSGSISASYALTSSYALSASWAPSNISASYSITASYVRLITAALYPITASWAISASMLTITSSQLSSTSSISSSWASSSVYSISSSWASQSLSSLSASWASQSLSSSYLFPGTYNITSSWSNFGISSSYAITASYIPNSLNAFKINTTIEKTYGTSSGILFSAVGSRTNYLLGFSTDNFVDAETKRTSIYHINISRGTLPNNVRYVVFPISTDETTNGIQLELSQFTIGQNSTIAFGLVNNNPSGYSANISASLVFVNLNAEINSVPTVATSSTLVTPSTTPLSSAFIKENNYLLSVSGSANVSGSITTSFVYSTSSWAVSASWAPPRIFTGSTYPFTSSWAVSSSMAVSSSYSLLSTTANNLSYIYDFTASSDPTLGGSAGPGKPTGTYVNLGTFNRNGFVDSTYTFILGVSDKSLLSLETITSNIYNICIDASAIGDSVWRKVMPISSHVHSGYPTIQLEVSSDGTSVSLRTINLTSPTYNTVYFYRLINLNKNTSFTIDSATTGTDTPSNSLLPSSFISQVNNQLIISGSTNSTGNITAPLFVGTSSWASACVSSSYAVSASWAPSNISASYALTSSYAVSASWAPASGSSISSSYSLTGSWALTASYALNAASTAAATASLNGSSASFYELPVHSAKLLQTNYATINAGNNPNWELIFKHGDGALWQFRAPDNFSTNSFRNTLQFCASSSNVPLILNQALDWTASLTRITPTRVNTAGDSTIVSQSMDSPPLIASSSCIITGTGYGLYECTIFLTQSLAPDDINAGDFIIYKLERGINDSYTGSMAVVSNILQWNNL